MSEKLARIQFTITTPGWVDDLLPDMQREQATALDVLQRPAHERGPAPFSDDFLRGYLRGLRYATSRPAMLMTEEESRIQQEKKDAEPPPPAAGSPYAREGGPESA